MHRLFLLILLGATLTVNAASYFSYTLAPDITSWEFQLDTPLGADYYTNITLALYAQYASDASNNFDYHDINERAAFQFRKLIISHNSSRSALVYIKERIWTQGSRAGLTDLTVKFQHIPSVSTFQPLTNLVAGIVTKLENDVHCTYNAVSYSVTNPNVTYGISPSTLGDIVSFISPDLLTYIGGGVTAATALVEDELGTGTEIDSNVYFNHAVNHLQKVKAGSTMFLAEESTKYPVPSTQELSVRVKRSNTNSDADLGAALSSATSLFTFLSNNATLNDGSCVTPPPRGSHHGNH